MAKGDGTKRKRVCVCWSTCSSSLPLKSMARGAGLAYLYTTLGPVTAVAQGQAVAD